MEIKTLHELDTEQPADCLEWCPHPDYPHHFICGTYHLEDGETDFTKPPTSTIPSPITEIKFNQNQLM